jgi:hypothetical protein
MNDVALQVREGCHQEKKHAQHQVQAERRQERGTPTGDELQRQAPGLEPQQFERAPQPRVGVGNTFQRVMDQLLGARNVNVGCLPAVGAEVTRNDGTAVSALRGLRIKSDL